MPGGGVRCNYAGCTASTVRYRARDSLTAARSKYAIWRSLGRFGRCDWAAKDKTSEFPLPSMVEQLYIVGGLSCRLSVVSLAGSRNDGLGEVEKDETARIGRTQIKS